MPTRVIDFELTSRPVLLSQLGSYPRALLLLRWRGVPVGQVTLPVTDGQIPTDVLEPGLARALGRDFWFAWLRDSVGWDAQQSAVASSRRVTVGICTRERPEDLARALGALARLSPAADEVLVVDNRPASTATAAVVRAHPFARYVREDGGGLNAARNRILAEARNGLVAFTDDDAAPDPKWLAAIVPNFDDPAVMCVTGLTMPLELETEAQELFECYSPFGRGFARRTFDSRDCNPLAAGRAGAGANMALRRSVVDRAGWFDEALDAGTATRSGGDHEFFSRILAAGDRIVYEPKALSWHRHRRTRAELKETLAGYGTGVYAMWTRALIENRELSVFKMALAWMWQGQVPHLAGALLRRDGSMPVDLLLAEYRGCLRGPGAYLQSRRLVARRGDTAGAGAGGPRIPVTSP